MNKQIHYTGQYFANKSTFIEMLKSLYSDSKIPDMKTLKNDKALLSNKLNSLKQELATARNLQKELQTVHGNVTAILGNDTNLKSKQQEAEL